MHRRDALIHLVCLVCWLGGSAALFEAGLGTAALSVYDTVHLGALSVVGVVWYSLVLECLRACTPAAWGLRRRADRYHEYQATEGQGETEVVSGVPRLTIGSVWSLVYGLGFVFFVAAYCFTGQQAVCCYCLAVGLVALCVEEACSQHGDCGRALPYAAATALGAGGVLLVVADMGWPTNDTDAFGILWGMLFPALAPLLFWRVKTNRRYSLGGVVEQCEFGMPFAGIVGVICLCVMDAADLRGLTAADLARADPRLLLAVLGGPWVLVPCLVCFTSAVLQGRAVDPLLALALVMAGRRVLADPESGGGIAAVCLAWLGLLVRVWGLPPRPDPAGPGNP